MTFPQLFLQRHDVAHDFWIAELWRKVPDGLMRQRAHPHLNSLAWIVWHMLRAEDAGVNRFVVDRPQIFDEGEWLPKLNLPWRHIGSGMTLAEVDLLSQRIDLGALRGYSEAVRQRTREIVMQIEMDSLDATITSERARVIVIDEGVGYPNAEGLVENYTGWSKGRCLMNFGLTHLFEHIGEVSIIATLLDVSFE